MRAQKITIAEVEFTAFTLANKLMRWNEPIPEFGTRFPNILESCIENPFTKFDKKDLYRGLIGKAAILFYLMIKNHPFQNGNKRIAVMTLLYFLYKNAKWLSMTNIDLYNFARNVAESTPQERGREIMEIQEMLEIHLIDWRED